MDASPVFKHTYKQRYVRPVVATKLWTTAALELEAARNSALMDFRTDVAGKSEWVQKGASCVPRPVPHWWSEKERETFHSQVQSALEPTSQDKRKRLRWAGTIGHNERGERAEVVLIVCSRLENATVCTNACIIESSLEYLYRDKFIPHLDVGAFGRVAYLHYKCA